jgi:hypothetical protein
MSEAISPGRRRALELGRQHGTIREDKSYTAPDGKPAGSGASAAAAAKIEKPLLDGATVKPAIEKALPFKRK